MYLETHICLEPESYLDQNSYDISRETLDDRAWNVAVGEMARGVEAPLEPHPENEFSRVPASLQERDGRLKEVDPETWTAA